MSKRVANKKQKARRERKFARSVRKITARGKRPPKLARFVMLKRYSALG